MPSHTSARRAVRTLVLAAFAATCTVVLLPPAASAHVTASSDTAKPGGYARVVFRVPNERDDASTTRLEVAFPTGHPFGSVSVQPVPGWTATKRTERLEPPVKVGEREVTEAVTAVVWEGGAVEPGQFQEFPVSLGPLPKADGELVFKALQTYSSGEVVRWIDVRQDGAPAPEHPAPTLTVAAPAAPPVAAPASAADPWGRVLGGAGLLTGLAGLGWAAALRKRPVPTTPAAAVRAGKEPSRV